MTKLTEGQIAPDFTAKSIKRENFRLYDVLKENKYTILYFYPKDFTMGCTKEACSFRDYYSLIKNFGAEVIGISLDDIETHKSFAKEHNLQFDLIHDEGGKISELYGVLKNIFGKKFASRVTFVINKDGKIIKVFNKVNASDHGWEIYEFLKSLG